MAEIVEARTRTRYRVELPDVVVEITPRQNTVELDHWARFPGGTTNTVVSLSPDQSRELARCFEKAADYAERKDD